MVIRMLSFVARVEFLDLCLVHVLYRDRSSAAAVYTGIGIHGAATAIVLSNYTSVGVLLVIIYVRKLHRMTWGGWSRESLKDWFQIARYGFPGFVMLAVERYTFEVGIFVTGYLADSEIQQGIHGILLRFKVILLMLPLSLGIAQSIRVGNELGSGEYAYAFQISIKMLRR